MQPPSWPVTIALILYSILLPFVLTTVAAPFVFLNSFIAWGFVLAWLSYPVSVAIAFYSRRRRPRLVVLPPVSFTLMFFAMEIGQEAIRP